MSTDMTPDTRASLTYEQLCALEPIGRLRVYWNDYAALIRDLQANPGEGHYEDDDARLGAKRVIKETIMDVVADLLDVPYTPEDDVQRTTGSAGLDAVKVARLRSAFEGRIAAEGTDDWEYAWCVFGDAIADLLGVERLWGRRDA
jgi:hypothetical protein